MTSTASSSRQCCWPRFQAAKCSAIRRCWIILPVLFYILLFLLNPLIRKSSSHKMKGLNEQCQVNFVVLVDSWLFHWAIYQFIPRAGFSRKRGKFGQFAILSLDFVSGLPYLAHFTLPFIYSGWLVVKKRDNNGFYQFLLAFGLACSIGVLMQYALPTPPPWMIPPSLGLKVEEPEAFVDFIPLPPEGNFSRIDSFLGFGLFKGLYSQNSLVCGAFPSLHTAWPAVLLFNKPWISRVFCWLHVCLIGFAAIWSLHHWILDVVFGFGIAWTCCRLSKTIIDRTFPKREEIVEEKEPVLDENVEK